VRQDRPVDPLGRQHVRVVDGRDLLDGERLGGAEHHVSGVVDDDVDAARFGQDCRDRGVDRALIADVHLDRAQLDVVLAGVVDRVRDSLGILACRTADAGVDGVPGVGEVPGRAGSEAAGGPGDDDGLGHGCPLRRGSSRKSGGRTQAGLFGTGSGKAATDVDRLAVDPAGRAGECGHHLDEVGGGAELLGDAAKRALGRTRRDLLSGLPASPRCADDQP
jgi:hypothetical protein